MTIRGHQRWPSTKGQPAVCLALGLIIIFLAATAPISQASAATDRFSTAADTPTASKDTPNIGSLQAHSGQGPFLQAVRAEVRDETVWVWLKNSGSGRLTSRHYRLGDVRVRMAATSKTIPLQLIDPDRRLAEPNRIVAFDTGLGLHGPGQVAVSFDQLPGTPARTFLLRPAPVLGPELTVEQEREPGENSRPQASLRPSRKSTPSRPAAPPPQPRQALAHSDCGLQVTLANRGRQLTAGQRLHIGWHTPDPPRQNNPFSIRLLSSDPDGLSKELTSTRPKTRHFAWRIPDGLPPGEYRISVGMGRVSPSSGLHACRGTSRPFELLRDSTSKPKAGRLARNTAQTEIISPHDGETFFLQQDLQLVWQSTDGDLTRLQLLKDDQTVFETTVVSPNGTQHSYRIADSFQRFVSGNDYQVRVETYVRSQGASLEGGESPRKLSSDATGYITLVNNWRAPNGDACSQDLPLNLLTPSLPDRVYAPGQRLDIRWCAQLSKDDAPQLLTIELVRDSLNGGGCWPVRSGLNASVQATEWTVPKDLPPGDGYRIRIAVPNSSHVSVSDYPFTIRSKPHP